VLLASNVDREANAENSSPGRFEELPIEQVWNSHWTIPLQSSMPSERDVLGGNLPTGELSTPGQDLIVQQSLTTRQTFPQLQGLTAQHNFLEPQSFIQTQGSVMPQTFMTAGVSQNVPMVPASIPPFIFQGTHVWQPIQADPSSLGWNQYHTYEPNQWSLLRNMNGYGIENHQHGLSSFVPPPNNQPDEMGFRHYPEFDWPSNEAPQWGN
jgi:hypothetical protein